MFTPKKSKHRKWQKGRSRFRGLLASRATEVSFGQYGLKATSECWISSRQIESARRAITHFVKRGGKIWIRIFPDKPVTTHGAVMGSGKGAPDHFVVPVKPGTVMFEIGGVSEADGREAMRLAGHKLPVLSRFVIRK